MGLEDAAIPAADQLILEAPGGPVHGGADEEKTQVAVLGRRPIPVTRAGTDGDPGNLIRGQRPFGD